MKNPTPLRSKMSIKDMNEYCRIHNRSVRTKEFYVGTTKVIQRIVDDNDEYAVCKRLF